MNPRGYFITGTDTGVGKTVFTCLLIQELRVQGRKVAAYKPACSGALDWGEGGQGLVRTGGLTPPRLPQYWSDVEDLYAATDGEFDRERICPQCFQAALSPPAAAALEGRVVDEAQLIAGYQWLSERADVVLVEGAGGFYSPISTNWLNADVAERVALPVLIVAPNRLGTINQTLLTIEAVRRRGLDVAGVVLNQLTPNPDDSVQTNASEIRRRGSIEIFAEVGYEATSLRR